MKYEFDSQEFSRQIKTKRVIELNAGMRDVAKKAKVSISTLSRLENGKTPDMPSLISVCNWLESSPSSFFKIKTKTVKKNKYE
jgi:transcriptional regulator with XRE-family HTH domain